METLRLLIISFSTYINSAGCMDYTSRFKTVSNCSTTNINEIEWSQFDNVAIVAMDDASIISQVEVSTEDFCIASCHRTESCVAIQVNTTTDGMVMCKLLSYTTSIGKVRNQTGIKLLFKGSRKLYNIDTDVSRQCDGFTECSTLIVDGNVYLTMADKHYNSRTEAEDACRSMPTPNGEFDLAIIDTASKIDAVKTFITALPRTHVWLYTGGESGVGVNHAANKWTRTGEAIDPDLWNSVGVQEPNNADEHCVMITKTYNGLIDTGCSGEPVGAGHEINTLCEFFPD